jgi:hypothetical protein
LSGGAEKHSISFVAPEDNTDCFVLSSIRFILIW